jgi:hypothetical protein
VLTGQLQLLSVIAVEAVRRQTWQQSDEDISYIMKYGRFPSMPADLVSFMAAFDALLDDREILSVMAA